MGTPTYGTGIKLAIDQTVTVIADFDAGSEQYEPISETLRKVQTHADSLGMRGTRSRIDGRQRIPREDVGGNLLFAPTPVELDDLLPRILGAAEVADAFDLAETLPSFGVLVDRGAERFVYTGCQVNRATFSGSASGLITLSLDILGQDETHTTTSFSTAIPAIDGGQPYIFGDVSFVFAADASATEVQSFEIIIDNFLDANHFNNSVTRTRSDPMDRLITVNTVLMYTADEKDLLDQAIAGNTGTMKFTNGNQSTLFTFANLKVPYETPTYPSRDAKGLINLRMQVYGTAAGDELSITHDSTA